MTTAKLSSANSIIERLKAIPRSLRQTAFEEIQNDLSECIAADVKYHWPLWARENQVPSDDLWRIWLLLAGRGFGKTRTGTDN